MFPGKISKIYLIANMFWAAPVLNYAFANGWGRKGSFLAIEEECYYPMLAFSFYLYFHICSSNKSIGFINAKQGVVQDVVHIFLTTQPLCYNLEFCLQFRLELKNKSTNKEGKKFINVSYLC